MSEELKDINVKGESVSVDEIKAINLKGTEISIPSGSKIEICQVTATYNGLETNITMTDFDKFYIVFLNNGATSQLVYSGFYDGNDKKQVTIYSYTYIDTVRFSTKGSTLTVYNGGSANFYSNNKYMIILLKE